MPYDHLRVLVLLVKIKCLPARICGDEAYPVNNSAVNNSQMQSFEYVIYSNFTTIFATRSKDVIEE